MVASAADRRVLAGADLSGVNLTSIAFVGEPLDLTGTKFDGATLTGTSFALARLAGASFVSVIAPEPPSRTPTCRGTAPTRPPPANRLLGAEDQPAGANFGNANVSGASFVGADLSSAIFTGALGVDTDFSRRHRQDAGFARAHVYGNGQAFARPTI